MDVQKEAIIEVSPRLHPLIVLINQSKRDSNKPPIQENELVFPPSDDSEDEKVFSYYSMKTEDAKRMMKDLIHILNMLPSFKAQASNDLGKGKILVTEIEFKCNKKA